jgi:hypothetical protein
MNVVFRCFWESVFTAFYTAWKFKKISTEFFFRQFSLSSLCWNHSILLCNFKIEFHLTKSELENVLYLLVLSLTEWRMYIYFLKWTWVDNEGRMKLVITSRWIWNNEVKENKLNFKKLLRKRFSQVNHKLRWNFFMN